jgi:cytochrome c biogenesis protein CcmG, thiol:disulfide interchange protein DsbE
MTSRAFAVATAVVLALIVIAAVAFYYVGPWHRGVQTASQSPIVGKVQVGKTAPEFEVSTTGGLFDLATANRPVFLEVFATWCPHCQRMTSVVDKLYEKYRSRVAFVGVSGSDTAMDGTSASSEIDVLNWARRFNVQYPVAYDPLLNVANLYLQGGFPTFALIGNDKKITYLNSGELPFGELDSAVAKLLR